jgi:hypothetical protein
VVALATRQERVVDHQPVAYHRGSTRRR